ncbi:hypothetical protein JKP88DRAFT_331106 [Tribonema minus]|uniref:Uncharacterized protein n=1 Tax=Tribonema minus TaxID=303371 RepID=A0A835YNT1_9STRA|nr:hypothetical protein JKP88DRAFT_331106 [Tribonema minus]
MTMTAASRTERGQKLRALNWVKQVRNDLTSAEFALQLDQGLSGAESRGAGGKVPGLRRKWRSIDYDSIAVRLESNLRLINEGRVRSLGLDKAVTEEELAELQARLVKTMSDVSAAIVKQDQVDDEERGLRKEKFKQEQALHADTAPVEATNFAVTAPAKVAPPNGSSAQLVNGASAADAPQKGGAKLTPEFGLFVRDDGTVDWDGAIQSGREVARFGKELWERINGQDPVEEELKKSAAGGGGGGGGQLFGAAAKERKPDPPTVQVSRCALPPPPPPPPPLLCAG